MQSAQKCSMNLYGCCSVDKSCPSLCNPMNHTGLPCSVLSPRVCSNSCQLSQWCYLTISSSATLFSSCPQCFPEAGSFPISWLFLSDGQSIRTSASSSILPMNIQGWFRLTGLISLLLRDSQESSPPPQFKSINSSVLSLLYGSTLTSVHDYWKNHSFAKITLAKWFLCFLLCCLDLA